MGLIAASDMTSGSRNLITSSDGTGCPEDKTEAITGRQPFLVMSTYEQPAARQLPGTILVTLTTVNDSADPQSNFSLN
jgi:hypothetical protein